MLSLHPAREISSLKKADKVGKENKIKNYFQKSLSEKKQCLLLHPLTERKAKKQEEPRS
jgi:hypothetical protein